MVRVVSVVFNLPGAAAFPLVMLVADIAALAALHFVPVPVVSLMGGISSENLAIATSAATWNVETP